jgi:arginine deiminase
MVFTFIDKDICMIYEPVVLNDRYRTIHIDNTTDNVVINDEKNLLVALENLGLKITPMFCGGKDDVWHQEREQWHSGANFLTLAPGKIIGYRRNTHTIDYLEKNGFKVIKADDVIDGSIDPNNFEKFVITIQGSELARGGGGCRCMSMPLLRDELI